MARSTAAVGTQLILVLGLAACGTQPNTIQNSVRAGSVAPPIQAQSGAPAAPPTSGSPGSSGVSGGFSGAPARAGAGGAAAGSSGTAGKAGGAGSAGTGPVSSATAIVRGPEPTEDSASNAGPYPVEQYTSGWMPSDKYSAATVYYPKSADAKPPYGIVVICPGFTAVQADIAPWAPLFASHGIVTMTIDTNTTGDSVVIRSEALLAALESLKSENDRADGPLKGKLDTNRAGLMGWSMGGGGTWIDASTHPELKTAVTLAGHIATAPGNDFSKITVPTLMLAGESDTAILGGGMSQPVYDAIPETTPKMIFEVTGADHFYQNDPANNMKSLGRYGLSWQKVFLEGDMRYRKFLLVPGPNASDFRTNVK